ncbi:ATP-binding protein [Bosea sp. BIWAKO-01]|uniref:ATP-binding protein n=1 Tax=Bosea sp. BIWAKO-01 TaxID=506668 RepID=UPI000852CFA5|nr:ATP-binding protein [Bosea sp. BIWAKO-01]GAU82395.1 sensor protein basS/pmrB [Bosea sp. BIWAKO-01]
MTSLRTRLFVILIAATGLIWLSAVAWIYLDSRSKLEHVLDTRLQEAAKMVHSLVDTGRMPETAIAGLPGATVEPAFYERQLSCQIWSLDGRLVARSSGAPGSQLTDQAAGFSDRTVDGERWRVYAVEDAQKGIRVMVGDRIGLRHGLVNDLIAGLLAPALLIAPLLGLLIWLSLGRGLRPLATMAAELKSRDAEDMRPLAAAEAPIEVRPLADALNGLFDKVAAARRHEREITAFAAHELRTPLAGLKTQAQIALATTDATIREGALRQILISVDRTARLVRQLLTLAKLETEQQGPATGRIRISGLLAEIIDSTPPAAGIDVELDPGLAVLEVPGDRESLALALRNLHENAIQHMPRGGTVSWRPAADGRGVAVCDQGPGIPQEELGLVTQRFYRGRHKSPTGTGLGLTIVDIAARRIGALLVLSNRTDGPGLQAALLWNEGSLRR